MVEQRGSGGPVRMTLVVLGCLGLLGATLAVIVAALVILFLGVRPQADVELPVVGQANALAAPPERNVNLRVCADERPVRLLAPSGQALSDHDLDIETYQRVGALRGGEPVDPVAMARYGWVAMDEQGGFLRWWQPAAFTSLDTAQQGISEVLGYCEVCCASGTVRLSAGVPELIWLEDDRFALPGGVRVGASFDAAVRASPAGTPVYEDEMSGLPGLSLPGVLVQGSLDRDRVSSLVLPMPTP